jgi:hypothetical protein
MQEEQKRQEELHKEKQAKMAQQAQQTKSEPMASANVHPEETKAVQDVINNAEQMEKSLPPIESMESSATATSPTLNLEPRKGRREYAAPSSSSTTSSSGTMRDVRMARMTGKFTMTMRPVRDLISLLIR